MNKFINLLALIGLTVVIYSCQPDIQYRGNKDLIGNWEGKTVEIVSPSKEQINFAVNNYGYSNLSLSRDSTYTFILKLSKDVVLKKEVFGNPYEKIILRSGYENFKKGYYFASDSNIVFYDANKIISNEYNYFFNGEILYTKFFDKDNNRWEISWKK